MRRARLYLPAALLLTLLAGCSVLPGRAPPAAAPVLEPPLLLQQGAPSAGEEIARIATGLIGRPYEFGGADSSGFDCSGLALYAYAQIGIAIPRTAAAQERAAAPVALAALRPGDLVFFRLGRHGIDHVGIYTGAGRFVHAPHRGVAVTQARLAEAYFARRVVSGGRFAELISSR